MLRIIPNFELKPRTREPRFSHDFWKALGLAAAFHVSLFLVFRIASLPNLDSLKPIIPTRVEIDLGARETAALLPSLQIIHSPLEVLAPPHFLDNLLEISLIEVKTSSFYSQKRVRREPDFSEIEIIDYAPLESLVEEERP